MLNYAQPKTVPDLYKEGKTPGYLSNEIFKHFLQSCGRALYRETNLSEIDSRIINFLHSLGIVVFNIIQGYIQISPRMKPLAVCMQGMNLLLWSVNSSTSTHAFFNHSDRTEIWRKHFCCLVINNDSVPTLTPSECTLLLNLPGCTKKNCAHWCLLRYVCKKKILKGNKERELFCVRIERVGHCLGSKLS